MKNEDIYANLADVEAEAAAQRAHEEATKAERERAAEAERENARKLAAFNERKMWNDMRRPHLVRLVEEMNKLQAASDEKAELVEPDAEQFKMDIKLLGVSLIGDLAFKEEYQNTGRFSRRATGRYRLAVGGYGETTSFPQKNDGSFSYDKVALLLRNKALRTVSRNKAEAVRLNNKAAVRRVMSAVGIEGEYSSHLSATSDVNKPVELKFSFCRNLTEADAIALIAYLKGAGIQVR